MPNKRSSTHRSRGPVNLLFPIAPDGADDGINPGLLIRRITVREDAVRFAMDRIEEAADLNWLFDPDFKIR
jgi:hypothetical protein